MDPRRLKLTVFAQCLSTGVMLELKCSNVKHFISFTTQKRVLTLRLKPKTINTKVKQTLNLKELSHPKNKGKLKGDFNVK